MVLLASIVGKLVIRGKERKRGLGGKCPLKRSHRRTLRPSSTFRFQNQSQFHRVVQGARGGDFGVNDRPGVLADWFAINFSERSPPHRQTRHLNLHAAMPQMTMSSRFQTISWMAPIPKTIPVIKFRMRMICPHFDHNIETSREPKGIRKQYETIADSHQNSRAQSVSPRCLEKTGHTANTRECTAPTSRSAG